MKAPFPNARPPAGAAASRWGPRLAALLLWAAAGASAVAWALKFGVSPPMPAATPVAALTPALPTSGADADALARLLGAKAVAADATTTKPAANALQGRFVLTGVVAARSARGAALLAVDGKPPRPFTVGARIDEGLVLQSVGPRSAVIAVAMDQPPLLTLELPKLASVPAPAPASSSASSPGPAAVLSPAMALGATPTIAPGTAPATAPALAPLR